MFVCTTVFVFDRRSRSRSRSNGKLCMSTGRQCFSLFSEVVGGKDQRVQLSLRARSLWHPGSCELQSRCSDSIFLFVKHRELGWWEPQMAFSLSALARSAWSQVRVLCRVFDTFGAMRCQGRSFTMNHSTSTSSRAKHLQMNCARIDFQCVSSAICINSNISTLHMLNCVRIHTEKQ